MCPLVHSQLSVSLTQVLFSLESAVIYLLCSCAVIVEQSVTESNLVVDALYAISAQLMVSRYNEPSLSQKTNYRVEECYSCACCCPNQLESTTRGPSGGC